LAFDVRHSAVRIQPSLDALLVAMTIIWGTNYAIVKSAFRDIDPQAFNALRLLEASLVMGTTMIVARRIPRAGSVFHTSADLTRRDVFHLVLLGLVGHCIYQYLFVSGLSQTSVANSALIISCTPIVITLLSVVSTTGGRERIGARHWAGTVISLAGIYLIVGRGAHVSGDSVRGDLTLMCAVVCWAVYTIGSRPLMERHSPVGVTALSIIFGTVLYLPLAAPALSRVAWHAVPWVTWAKLVYSALFAICIAYTIWYSAVRAIGSARTAVYSNLMPIVAMTFAALWLHEPVGAVKIAGAATILAGVALTRRTSASE
jgi:drug/metabolite transporter (DMT)-like permease